jgi:hypothetical protein
VSGHPASFAIVTSSKWKSEDGALRTTIVGKLTVQLADDNRSELTLPDPLIAFDRIAPDGRHVLEAGELMPWTSRASVAVYRGPLRLSLETGAQRPFVVTASAKSPAGYSMASSERSSYASIKPSRGADGVLSIPDKVDGRYFLAAPKAHQLDALRGDEAFLLELPGWECRTALPGVSIVVALDIRGRRREVALRTDMLAVNGESRLVSIIARALVHGDATPLAHRIVSLSESSASDPGDPRHFNEEETSFLGEERTSFLPEQAPPAATPFERGASKAPLRVDVPARVDASAKMDAPAPNVPVREPTVTGPPAPKVAPPRAGAMAKPMLKRR